jgi:CDP-glucose 4,6-dehydratase
LKLEKLDKFWKNKRVLIIGHTGFTGSWLILILNYLGSIVSGYSLNAEKKYIIFNALKLKKKLKYNCFGDINNSNKLSKFIKKTKPQIIINLAAQSLVKKSYTEPLETYNTNLIGAIKLLYLCKNFQSIKSIVMVTTDKVYLNQKKSNIYKETDLLGGSDPYSSSKAASEIAISSFDKSFFNKKSSAFIATARSGNIIGGGDWSKNRLIPDLIKSYYNNKILIIRMPWSIRPWQHVLEAVYGYLLLAQSLYQKKKNAKGAWNFGPERKNFLKVEDFLNKINSELKLNIKWKFKKSTIYETDILKLNNNKSKKYLKWKPILSVKKMIDFTFSWYKQYFIDKSKLNELSLSQIKFFLNKIK